MLESLRRFSALGRPAQELFLRALMSLPLISLSLRFGGFRATRAMLQRMLSPSIPSMDSDAANQCAALTARMVNAAGRHSLTHPSCLAKSLALWWLLARQGIPSRLRIGIRKENGRLEAHAWIEREGAALNEREEHHRHYAAFDAEFASLLEDER